MNTLLCKLSILNSISAVIDEPQNHCIHGKVKPSEEYTDSYEYTSFFDNLIIPTKNKFLRHDVIIHPIPITEIDNQAGGLTLTIG